VIVQVVWLVRYARGGKYIQVCFSEMRHRSLAQK